MSNAVISVQLWMKVYERNVSQKLFLKAFVLKKFQFLQKARKVGRGVCLSKGEVSQIRWSVL